MMIFNKKDGIIWKRFSGIFSFILS